MAKGFLYDEGDALITRKEDVGGLPDPEEASAGDVLTLDEDKEPVWSEPSGGLPDTSEASIGDVLTLNEDKDPVWSTPSGGGGDGPIVVAYLSDLSTASPKVSFAKPNTNTPLTFSELVDMGEFVIVGMYSSCVGNAFSEEEGGQTYKGINMSLTEYIMSLGHFSTARVYSVSAQDDELTDDMTVFPVEADSSVIEFSAPQ